MAKNEVIDQKEFKKLMKSLQEFPQRIQRNVMNGSTRAAAKVVSDEMHTRVPYETGTLEDAIRIKKYRSKKDTVIYNVGIKKITLENGSKIKDTKQYAYYLEMGTQKMAARPFIRPTLHSVGNKPVEAARKYFEPRMEKEARKLGLGTK